MCKSAPLFLRVLNTKIRKFFLRVLKSERPDVDKKRSDLLKLQGEFAVRLRHLEKALLSSLNEAKGSILEDETVIGTLETLKSEAAEIQQKVSFYSKFIQSKFILLIYYELRSSLCFTSRGEL